MKKNNRFAALLAVMLAASLVLAACGQAPVPASSQEPSSQSEESSSSSSSSEPPSSSEASASETESSSEASVPESSSSAAPSSSSSSQAAPSSSSSSSQEQPVLEPESSQPETPPPAPAANQAPANLGIAAPSLPHDGEYLRDVESEVIDYINEERARLGLGELTYDPNLRSAARIRSAEMYKNKFFSHDRPDGTKWHTVLKVEVPIRYANAAENIAAIETPANYDKIESAHYWYTQWEGSPSHYAAMIDPRYTHVGVGIAYVYDGSSYHGYAATLFASY